MRGPESSQGTAGRLWAKGLPPCSLDAPWQYLLPSDLILALPDEKSCWILLLRGFGNMSTYQDFRSLKPVLCSYGTLEKFKLCLEMSDTLLIWGQIISCFTLGGFSQRFNFWMRKGTLQSITGMNEFQHWLGWAWLLSCHLIFMASLNIRLRVASFPSLHMLEVTKIQASLRHMKQGWPQCRFQMITPVSA